MKIKAKVRFYGIKCEAIIDQTLDTFELIDNHKLLDLFLSAYTFIIALLIIGLNKLILLIDSTFNRRFKQILFRLEILDILEEFEDEKQ